MNSHRRAAILVGAFFLISNITFIVGGIILVEPILAAPDYLSQVAGSRPQLVLGVLLELINSFAYVGIAAIMFTVLRPRFESLALWYAGFLVIEFVTQVLADIGALRILTLSEEFLKAGAPQSSPFEALGGMLLSERFWSFQMLNIVFCVSALVLYYMLYRSRLIPRAISVWGLIGAALVLVSTVLEWFGIGLGTTAGMITGLPMLLNELFLGVWLIAKGFRPAAIAAQLGESGAH